MGKRNWQAERLTLISEEHRAEARLAELESTAGIADKVERALQGHFIPISVSNPELADDEYAWNHDYARERMRDLYFAVADERLRTDLIQTRREVRRLRVKLADLNLEEARDRVKRERSRWPLVPWLGGAFVGVCCVIGGYRYFGTVGLVGGAVAGVLIGQGLAHQSKAERAAELAAAESELRDLVQHGREMADLPDYFTEREASTGEREKWFDDESAVERRLARAPAERA